MSTDLQNFSIQHQSEKIREYAILHNIDIVMTYADEGKSGLDIRGRTGLTKMIADVQSGNVQFGVILVYDVSRWGRFQDADESAYYDHVCRRAGIEVIYCAEPFENDGSTGSTILKSLKRAMAAEYSRELSSKVFQAQCAFIRMGYRQGGSAGYGYRRLSISEDDSTQSTLKRGQRKINLTDRVVLTLGPQHEIDVIKSIYDWYLVDKLSEAQIIRRLNDASIQSETGGRWTRCRVRGVLTNEKYVGTLLYNCKSVKLKRPAAINPKESWIRTFDAFTSIISRATFDAAQIERAQRARYQTDAELLVMLKALREKKIVDRPGLLKVHDGIPGKKTYIGRFGSLSNAYRLAGIPLRQESLKGSVSAKRIKILSRSLVDEALQRMRRASISVSPAGCDTLVIINQAIVVKLLVCPSRYGYKHQLRWNVSMDDFPTPDFVLAILLDEGNASAERFYLLPRNSVPRPTFIFKGERPDDFAEFRASTLARLFGQQS